MSQAAVDKLRKRRRDDDEYDVPTVTTLLRKRNRSHAIHGQNLPVARKLEVLDREGLQQLIGDLIQLHPEIETTLVNQIPTRPTVEQCIDIIRAKYDDVIAHLPYKCSVELDYLYLRVKPYIRELLACMLDFILHFLPPVETDITNLITFLEAATSVLDQLPNFTNLEFQYTQQTAYEQVANTWLLVVLVDADDETQRQKARLLTKMDALECLERHNTHARGKFNPVIEYLKSHVDDAAPAPAPGFSDLITVDYSKYCTPTVSD